MNWKILSGEKEYLVTGRKTALVTVDDDLVEILIKETTLHYPAQTLIRVWADGDSWDMDISQGYNINEGGYAAYPRLPDKELLLFIWELLEEGHRKGFLPPLVEE